MVRTGSLNNESCTRELVCSGSGNFTRAFLMPGVETHDISYLNTTEV